MASSSIIALSGECGVCYNNYYAQGNGIHNKYKIDCGHPVCIECAEKIYSRGMNCPMCRHTFETIVMENVDIDDEKLICCGKMTELAPSSETLVIQEFTRPQEDEFDDEDYASEYEDGELREFNFDGLIFLRDERGSVFDRDTGYNIGILNENGDPEFYQDEDFEEVFIHNEVYLIDSNETIYDANTHQIVGYVDEYGYPQFRISATQQ